MPYSSVEHVQEQQHELVNNSEFVSSFLKRVVNNGQFFSCTTTTVVVKRNKQDVYAVNSVIYQFPFSTATRRFPISNGNIYFDDHAYVSDSETAVPRDLHSAQIHLTQPRLLLHAVTLLTTPPFFFFLLYKYPLTLPLSSHTSQQQQQQKKTKTTSFSPLLCFLSQKWVVPMFL